MGIPPNNSNAQLIQENVEYVMGMYDLYQNDSDIKTALFRKGLDARIVEKVLIEVKKPGYEKRIRQSKRIMLVSALLLVLFAAILLVFNNINGADSLLNSQKPEETLLRVLTRSYGHGFYYVIALTVVQFFYGLARFSKYSRLLKKTAED